MEAVAVFGGVKPCISSLHPSPIATAANLTNYSHKFTHLFAFHQSSSSLLSLSSPPLSHATLRSKNRPNIFLPHLVASMEDVEQTYIMIKPDGVQRGFVGEIISRFEKKGFKLTGLKLFRCPKELAEQCKWHSPRARRIIGVSNQRRYFGNNQANLSHGVSIEDGKIFAHFLWIGNKLFLQLGCSAFPW
ncbi:nucleoside-diphosphate kinase [Ranunculus cassubicifolius]